MHADRMPDAGRPQAGRPNAGESAAAAFGDTSRSMPSAATTMLASGALSLSGFGARAILLLFIGTQGLLALANLGDVRSPWPSILGLILVTLGATLLTLRAEHPYPMRLVGVVLAVVAATTVLVTWNMPERQWLGYAGWHWGALTFMLFVLALRGRIRSAWLGFLMMASITIFWAVVVGRGPASGVDLVIRHAGMLLIATLFAIGLRRVGRRTLALADVQLASAQHLAAAAAAVEEQRAGAATLDRLARPILERLAGDGPLTEQDRRDAARVEAQLRDRIRGTALVTPRVEAAVQAAREAGSEVVLLDDRGGHDLTRRDLERVENTTLAALAAQGIRRVTVRLLPPGRDRLATLVVQRDGGSDSIIVTREVQDSEA